MNQREGVASSHANHQRLLVAVCTYNERENLPDLIADIHAAVPQADVLVVDDASPDGTGDWATQQAEVAAWLTVIRRSGKQGLGSAIVAAMRHAIAADYQFMVNLDGDRSHDPAEIPKMMEAAGNQNADVVIGSRYVPGGAIQGWPWTRKLISGLLNRAARFGLGLTAHDCSGAYRCYRVVALKQLDLGQIRASGYAMLEEILCLLTHRNATIVEVPITFANRAHGASKLNLREAIKSMGMLVIIAVSKRR